MADSLWPLFEQFPALASLERVALRKAPTPVVPLEGFGDRLWIKRDDLTADPIGGNKVRGLELLLPGAARRGTVITAGSEGSTHALTTAVHARGLGARTVVATWPQEMNAVAERVSAKLGVESERRRFSNPIFALAWLQWRSLRGEAVIPAGGTSPLGILGHVNAAFELAAQIRSHQMPLPSRVVVPLGTGGTAAGLSLGFALAGVRTEIIAARVVPAVVGRVSRVVGLAKAAARLMDRMSGRKSSGDTLAPVTVVGSVYGGAYGRPLPAATAIEERLRESGVTVDPTYSGKAFVIAASAAKDSDTLFWLTFDSRWFAGAPDR